ncbi:glycosyltransferase family 2 protein [Flavobacterium terrigena]|uniref:Glycosyltransferase, GT2 family n=1 Tax=Flavobacterium terrigena TaxID=402734 RepID=A0A1H6QXV8_9FLAO|nr:glycosyltransferase family 2 protein [Flavobacterium terrigena]SEI48353.1 Glycosyltransferase, GT2 family [Flavobacterium terrigena]
MIKFSILISTKNRLEDLQLTLQKISHLLQREDVECIIYDDGSTDKTSEFLKENHTNIQLLTNQKSKGYIYNRNYLLNNCKGKYAISLDDDSNFITENCLEIIENHFETNENCGVIACRIFWSKEEPFAIHTNEVAQKVSGFVGCGHIWNMDAWKKIPNYPEWFEFYGEEDFASLQLVKKGLEIHYVPEILVHHRVNVSARKKDKDYQIRRRRSLRAGWYNYFMFYPISIVPKKMLYTIWQQLKNHTFKGNSKATFAMFQAILDLLLNSVNIFKTSNRLTHKEYKEYCNLAKAKIYWNPNEK